MDNVIREPGRVEDKTNPDALRDRSGVNTTDDRTRNFTFTPKAAVTAIAFHLVDERLAKSVDPRSADRVLARLANTAARRPIQVAVALWQGMLNRQRLEWLLAATGARYRLRPNDNDVAELTLAGG
jgi:hypothetical protein